MPASAKGFTSDTSKGMFHMSIRMIRALVALTALVVWSPRPLPAATADDIEFHESRPLGKLTAELGSRYSYLVTYEEAPYDEGAELFTNAYANGRRFRYPAWKPITFHGTAPKTATSGSGSLEQGSAAAATVAESAVAQYNSSGNPGRFQVIKDGDYVQVVPAGRSRNGKFEPFQPILDTKVTFVDSQYRSCLDVLNDLIAQIDNLRGVNIANNVPLGPLIRHQCRVEGVDLTARDAFKQFLQQIELPQQNPAARFRYSWGLMYDVNDDMYFLTIDPVDQPPSPAPVVGNALGATIPDKANTTPVAGSVHIGFIALPPK
jgi:hypothetical protein